MCFFAVTLLGRDQIKTLPRTQDKSHFTLSHFKRPGNRNTVGISPLEGSALFAGRTTRLTISREFLLIADEVIE
jgi:hypothetical protein